MTGADLKELFYSVLDEVTEGILHPDRINDMIFHGTVAYHQPLIEAYGINGVINDELRCLQQFVNIESPSDYQLNFASIPQYNYMVEVQTSYTLNGQTYVKTAQPLPYNAMVNSLSSGKVYAPRYQVNNDKLDLFPKEGTLNSVKVNYLRTVIPIDVTNIRFDLPYSNKTINGIVDKLISIYSGSLGDMEQRNIAEQSLIQSSSLPRK